MHARKLLGLSLLFCGVSLAEHIPPNHILWGEKGPPGATLLPKTRASHTVAEPLPLEERDTPCTNGPKSRSCWASGYSVSTDFDAKWPTTNVRTVTYNLEVTNTTCDPDGNGARMCFLFNGQYPGPTIQANWGDTLSVTLKNSLKDNATGIHWHGIRQLGTVGYDGVDGITECPLAPGKSKTYTFKLTQHGTTWYHSHYTTQYGEGLYGGLIINGPASADYDTDLGTYMVNDWYYQTASQLNSIAASNLQIQKPPPPADNILINGTNKNAAGGGAYGKVSLTKGKKYLLRLINSSLDAQIRVSLDGHPFSVVTSDLVPIQPFTTNWILLGIGQRANVIITANQAVGNYWFRAVGETSCASNNINGSSIFSYDGAAAGDPTSTAAAKPNDCINEGPLVPWVPNTVPSDTFTSQVKSLQVNKGPGIDVNSQNIVFWGVNTSAIDVDWKKPIYSYVIAGETDYPTTENLIALPTAGIWTYWIIQEVPDLVTDTIVRIPHPIHLHGHDFYLLGSAANSVFDNSSVSTLTFNNPPRRDVALLPAGGWLAIAFPTDNAGAWLMHCHIAWHISEGLGVQFLESASTIPGPPPDYATTCSDYAAFYDGSPAYKKEDSGL